MEYRYGLMTLQWDDKDKSLVLIDQRRLPNRLEYIRCRSHEEVAECIKSMAVRGAPAIGVAAAFGLALAAINSKAEDKDSFMHEMDTAFKLLRSTRPTAINLFWALERIMSKGRSAESLDKAREAMLSEAIAMLKEDLEVNRRLGEHGSLLLNDGDRVLTHCNAGALATVGYGTALGVIRAAREKGKRISVIATETRPVMQGARLTTFELKHDGIDVSIAPDTSIALLMARGMIDKVIVGADRVLRDGHVFNKIGTYQVAILAKEHRIPFYVAAPLSSFDLKSRVEDVVIEERTYDEVVKIAGKRVAPKGIRVFNPAFDLTPPSLITAIVTENGVLEPPYEQSIARIFNCL
ncbi:MAG: S-methyl-5-thioribose-1-phosphate isomerase [Candidatus Nitrosocaldus sp.]